MSKLIPLTDGSYLLPPSKRLIKFCLLDESERRCVETIELAFPYMVARIRDCWGRPALEVRFSNYIVDSYYVELPIPPLPHFDRNGVICGVKLFDGKRLSMEEVLVNFFGGTFIEGYHLQAKFISDTSLRTYRKWAEMSKNSDISFITTINW